MQPLTNFSSFLQKSRSNHILMILNCVFRFSASCSPDEDQYSGSEGVARGRSNLVEVERPRSRKMPTSKELPRSRGASKKAGLVSSKKLTTKRIPQITKKSPSSKSGSGSPSRSAGISRGLSKVGDQLGNSVRGKKRRKGGSKAKGKASGSRSRKDGRLNFKQTPKPNQLSQRAQVDGGSTGSDRSGSRSAPALTPAPPLPITGRKEEQVVEYDISLPELADYDLVEYTVDLDAPSLGPRPQPSPALLSALSP